MHPTPAEMLRDVKKASAAVRRKYNTPVKAMRFLIKAGLFERHAGSPGGVRPTKFYRD
jgi:hypothetical protein